MNWIRQVQDNLYGDLFTLEIRIILENFLSRHEKCISITASSSKKAQKFIQDLKTELSTIIQRLPSEGDANFIYKLLIQSQNQRFQDADDSYLFQLIQQTLQNESIMIQELRATSSQMEVDTEVQETSHSVEAPVPETQFVTLSRVIDTALTGVEMRIAEFGTRLMTKLAFLNEGTDASTFYDEIGMILEYLTNNHELVLRELNDFRDEQRHVSLGKSSDKNLDNFEEWFRKLLRLIQDLEEFHIPHLELLFEQTSFSQDLQDTKDEIKALRQSLFRNGYVIEKQPKQIILQGVNFGRIILRVLPWQQPNSEDPMSIVSETVTFINEATAQEIITDGPKQLESLATLKSKRDSRTPLVAVKTDNIIGYPRILATNLIDRNYSNDPQIRVSQRRFYLLFNVTLSWKGETYKMETLSLPIYYTTHGCQDVYSWTDMVYYNSIPRQYRNGIVTTVGPVPVTIPWSYLIEGIDQLFVGLGRKLSDQQKAYFKQKLCEDPTNDTTVSMEKFYNKSSFAEWLYHSVQILSLPPSPSRFLVNPNPIRKYWANGTILGFLTTEDVIANLKHKDPGTIIIRLPEMKTKYIGLYWYSAEKAKATNNKNPLLKQLLSIEQLNSLPLQDIILNSDGVVYIYSNYNVNEPGKASVLHKTEVFEASLRKKIVKPDERGYFTTVTKEQEYFPTELLRQLKLKD